MRDRLKEAWAGVVRGALPTPTQYLALHPGRVVAQSDDLARVDVALADPSIPSMGGVPLLLGVPGIRARLNVNASAFRMSNSTGLDAVTTADAGANCYFAGGTSVARRDRSDETQSTSRTIAGTVAGLDLTGGVLVVPSPIVANVGWTDGDPSKPFAALFAVPASTAELIVDANVRITLNGGTAGAARKGDTVKLTMSPAELAALATALLSTGAFLPSGSSPSPAASALPFAGGEITAASSTVRIG